jgi:hypothetical protein
VPPRQPTELKVRRAHAELHLENSHRNLASRTNDKENCPMQNGTTILSHDAKTYQIVCDIDFLDNDYPFQLVHSFEECVDACDAFNAKEELRKCMVALFVPSRLNGDDDCYLKSSAGHPTPAHLRIEGAVLVKASQSALPIPILSAPREPRPTTSPNGSKISDTAKPKTNPSFKPVNRGPEVKYAWGETVIIPVVVASNLHGPTQNTPTEKYLDVKSPRDSPLDDGLLVVGVNGDITTQYGLSLDTGILDVNESSQAFLAPLKNTPHISRDGGQGGYLNGHHLFIFSDTGSYSTTTSTADGDFLGFVSSSVAVDVGMNGLDGKALSLEDGMGEWSDDVGRMRGFAPLTQGEQSYNKAMQGKGQRYAIWPESSIIPLDGETALLYAPILYNNVNHDTKKAVFTYTGSTLLSVTAGGMGGPMAKRRVGKLFEQDEIEWGCAGGIRSWGPSGIGGTDGKVYVFGNIQGGILMSRTSAETVGDRNSVRDASGLIPSSTNRGASMSTGMGVPGRPRCKVDRLRHFSLPAAPSWMSISFIRLVTSLSLPFISLSTRIAHSIIAISRQARLSSRHTPRAARSRKILWRRCYSMSGLPSRFCSRLPQGLKATTSIRVAFIRDTTDLTTSAMEVRECCSAGLLQQA